MVVQRFKGSRHTGSLVTPPSPARSRTTALGVIVDSQASFTRKILEERVETLLAAVADLLRIYRYPHDVITK